MYIRQGAALQAQSVFAEMLVFRPHSTDTLTHRKMTMNMAEKTSKAQKVRMLANVGDNPDAQKKVWTQVCCHRRNWNLAEDRRREFGCHVKRTNARTILGTNSLREMDGHNNFQ
jgi:hypothetical protein